MRTFLVLMLLTCTHLAHAAADYAEKIEQVRPTRVAILTVTLGHADAAILGEMNAPCFRPSIASLTRSLAAIEDDGITTLVLRVDIRDELSPATPEMLREVRQFTTMLEDHAPRLRIIAWIDNATGTRTLAAWGVREHFCTPSALVGAMAPHAADLQEMPPAETEEWLALGDRVSALGRRDPRVARAMLAANPLSANAAKDGVVWQQDESGEHILNESGRVLTLNALDLARFELSSGIAATREDLAAAIGYDAVEWIDLP